MRPKFLKTAIEEKFILNNFIKNLTDLFCSTRIFCGISINSKILTKYFCCFASFLSILVGTSVLIGWITDIQILKSIITGWISMKANAAIGFILIGFSFFMIQIKNKLALDSFFMLKFLPKIFLFILICLASSTLFEYISGYNLGIDQLIFLDPQNYKGTGYPGRMGPMTSVNFILISFAIILMESKRTITVSQFLCLTIFLLLTLPLYGYVLDDPANNTVIFSYTRMAIHTAFTFFILSIGIFFYRTDQGIIKLIKSPTLGGTMLRRLSPTLIFGLPFLELLRMRGERLKLYTSDFGLSITLLCTIVGLLIILYWNASLINSIDQQRKKVEKSHEDNEQRFNLAMDVAQIGAWDLDLVTQTSIRSLRHDQIFGYESLLPKWNIEIFLRHISPENRDSVQEQIENAFKSKNFSLECQIIKPDHTLRWVLIQGYLYRDANNKPVRMLGTVIDITDKKLNEEKLKCYAIKLKKSNKELEDFASIASHDLQEPLRKVQAFGDRLKLKYSSALSEEGVDYLDRMLSAANRMHNLINALLTYSRLSTKANAFEDVSLKQIVTEVLSDLEIRIEQTHGQIEVSDLPNIEADSMQMRQLFQNIIGNALKFHRPNIPPVIKIFSNIYPGKKNQCEIVIKDNGIGFDEKYLDKLFNMFQRLHGRDEYEGTGIGLAVCRKIAERHLGGITAKSIPNQGTEFIITLTIKHNDAPKKNEEV